MSQKLAPAAALPETSRLLLGSPSSVSRALFVVRAVKVSGGDQNVAGVTAVRKGAEVLAVKVIPANSDLFVKVPANGQIGLVSDRENT
jgi:hypothetical protein